VIIVPLDRSWSDWRTKARQLLAEKVLPQNIHWKCEEFEFSFGEEFRPWPITREFTLPREFIETAMSVSAYRDDSTWDLLYRIAWRILYEDRNLLEITIDPQVRELMARRHSVGRDIHKMHAFVRFREIKNEEDSVFMAWHRPDHRILRLAIPFFKDRFNGMNWAIMTEDESVAWDKKELTFLPGIGKVELPPDEKEELWKTYYSSIFNPARVKVNMMKKEMAVRYWDTMPETQLISSLLDEASNRVKKFEEANPMMKPIQYVSSLFELHEAMKKCQSCGICAQSLGPVAGVGPVDAKLAIIGEQPGEQEDLGQVPFIGPAGQELARALEKVQIERRDIYLTNAVKGFKWQKGSIERKHLSADSKEISACRPWLQNELNLIKPKILVCLGRVAAQSVVGKLIKLDDVRGRFFATPLCEKTIVLPHPAAILRIEDPDEQELARQRFWSEMQMVKDELNQLAR
jgi:probable DNA metabolism protein